MDTSVRYIYNLRINVDKVFKDFDFKIAMRKEIENWWKQAEHDSKAAKNLYENLFYSNSSFCCQQATEKALKALLLDKGFELIKTHDLVLLARKLNAPEDIIQLCKNLTPVYVETRYPFDEGFKEFNKEETKEDIETMEEIIKWVKEKLL